MKWVSPTGSDEVRQQDPFGSGAFGASRDGGKRTHNGIDLVVIPKQTIVSPTDCEFLRISYPYKDDFTYLGAWFYAFEGLEFCIWYMIPYYYSKGDGIGQGENLGVAQNIAVKYGAGMTPHIHFGVRMDGEWIDPKTML